MQHAVTFPFHITYFIRHHMKVLVKTDNVNSQVWEPFDKQELLSICFPRDLGVLL